MKILRERRKARSMTLMKAADEVGIHFSSLSRIERGQQMPSPRVAKRIAAVYGISLDDLYGQAA